MRVNIDEIKEGGIERAWDLTRDMLDETVRGDQAGYRAAGPLHVEARLSRLGRRVRLAGQARADVTAPCGRCLAPLEVAVPVTFELNLVPAEEGTEAGDGGRRDRGDGGSEGSFTAGDVDEEEYRGKTVDLDPLVAEQVALALQPYPVCRADCKGLCPVCGQNLNEKDCACDRHVPDPRWAGLQRLKQRP